MRTQYYCGVCLRVELVLSTSDVCARTWRGTRCAVLPNSLNQTWFSSIVNEVINAHLQTTRKITVPYSKKNI